MWMQPSKNVSGAGRCAAVRSTSRQRSDAARGRDTQQRHAVGARVEREPVRHVAALVRAVDQHVGTRHRVDLGARLRQGGVARQPRPDVGRQVRADLRRVAGRVGARDEPRRAPRGAQHGRVVLGEVDGEPQRAQQFRRADAGAPGDLSSRVARGRVQVAEAGGHQVAQRGDRLQRGSHRPSPGIQRAAGSDASIAPSSAATARFSGTGTSTRSAASTIRPLMNATSVGRPRNRSTSIDGG